MIEFSIVLWFLMLLLFSSYELGNALSQYSSLSAIAYETARSASMIEGLPNGSNLSKSPEPREIEDCRQKLADTRKIYRHRCAFVIAYLRAQTLLQVTMPGVDPQTLSISMRIDHQRNITVAIRSPLASFIPFFRYFPVASSYTIPYLAVSLDSLENV